MGKFYGDIKPGEVRNPKGNPNPLIGEISKYASTGPRTDEGKFRGIIKRRALRANSKSKYLEKFYKCDTCPLRPKEEEKFIRGEILTVNIPPKCTQHRSGGSCVFKLGDFTSKMEIYYNIEQYADTMELQKSMTHSMLADAEMARQAEVVEGRKPGFYSARFEEMAARNAESINRLERGEIHKNLNVNVDMTGAVVGAYEKRKKKEDAE